MEFLPGDAKNKLRTAVLTPGVCPFFQIQRLPFLPSSNLALDTLRGSDEVIGFEDILNGQNFFPFNCNSCRHNCLNVTKTGITL